MIEARGLVFGYEEHAPVLDGLDLELGPGINLLLGPNGAGKSTLLKLLAGVEHPLAGSVSIEGHDLWKQEVEARRALHYLPEAPDLSPYAPVEEVLELVRRLRGRERSEAAAVLARVGLESRRRATVRQLSMGQRRRVLLAAAWIGTPRVILADEPLDAMDQGIRGEIIDWLVQAATGGATVVVISHEVEAFAAIADRAYVVTSSALVPLELPDDPDLRLELLVRASAGELVARLS